MVGVFNRTVGNEATLSFSQGTLIQQQDCEGKLRRTTMFTGSDARQRVRSAALEVHRHLLMPDLSGSKKSVSHDLLACMLSISQFGATHLGIKDLASSTSPGHRLASCATSNCLSVESFCSVLCGKE